MLSAFSHQSVTPAGSLSSALIRT